MPKMNGIEVCEATKNQLGLRDVQIIMLISEGQDYENQRLREVGADSFIMKPLDPDQVYEMAAAVFLNNSFPPSIARGC